MSDLTGFRLTFNDHFRFALMRRGDLVFEIFIENDSIGCKERDAIKPGRANAAYILKRC